MWLFYEEQTFYNYHDPSAATEHNTEIHPILFTDYDKMIKFIEAEYQTKCESIYPPYYGSKKITIPSEAELSNQSKHIVYEINYEQVYKGIIIRLSTN